MGLLEILGQGINFVSSSDCCSSRKAIGTACSEPACSICLVFTVFGDNLCIVKAQAALEMQPRSWGQAQHTRSTEDLLT